MNGELERMWMGTVVSYLRNYVDIT